MGASSIPSCIHELPPNISIPTSEVAHVDGWRGAHNRHLRRVFRPHVHAYKPPLPARITTLANRKELRPHIDKIFFTQPLRVAVEIRHFQGMAFEPELVVEFNVRTNQLLRCIRHMRPVLRPAKFVLQNNLAREWLNPCPVLPYLDDLL